MIISGSYAFVCAHGIREKRCSVCGPVFIHKEQIEFRDPKENDLVSSYSHIGGHMYASEDFPMESPDPQLEHQLLQVGTQLLSPPPSLQDLLSLLDHVDICLSQVGQSPSKSMLYALSVSQKALISDQLLTHSDIDIKVAVASCLIEIIRITAPDPPYDDEKMKMVFHLIISSLENISDNSCRYFKKRVTILETIAEVRIYMLILDLECDNLILEMFCCFLRNIRDYHPENVFSSMERIMTLVLEEREDVNVQLFAAILAIAKKNKEDVLPIARKLGEKVLENCSTKLKPYISQAVKQVGTPIEDYSDVISSLCQAALNSDERDEFPIGSKKMGTAVDNPSESFMRNGSAFNADHVLGELEVKKENGKPICQSWKSNRDVEDLVDYKCHFTPYVDPFLPPAIDFDPANSVFPTCPITTCKDKIEAILDEQMVITHEGQIQRFLVCWVGRPNSERTWMSRDVLQHLDPDLLKLFQSHQNLSLPNSGIVRKDFRSKPPITLVYDRRQKVVQPLNLWAGD